MLHRLRLGDGQLARFNGMGATERDALATVLAYDKGGRAGAARRSRRSGYVRLERGATVIMADAGDTAGAGARRPGVRRLPVVRDERRQRAAARQRRHSGLRPRAPRAAARGTASHNTLELNGQSSAKLVRDEGWSAASARHRSSIPTT